MKLALICIVLLVGGGLAKKEKADADFLKKQQAILKLTWRLNQPNEDAEQAKISKEYNPLDHLDSYSNPDVVQKFFGAVNSGEYKARGEIFNLFDPKDRKEAIELFDVLHFAKDWDLFYKTAVYARDRVNEGQFFYAFMVAIFHRSEGFVLPPPYEVFPHLFTNTDVIRKAYRAKMTQTPRIIPMSFTGTIRNPEQRVSYFGEDIGLNAHHAQWHAEFPFWWDQEKYGETKDRHGELFWYMHHQMTSRFDAERLSNGLQEVEELHWEKPILEGFVPKATYKNGQEFPSRPDNMRFEDLPFITVYEMMQYESRIRDGIAAGMLYDKNHRPVYLNESQGIDVLGNAIESSANSVNPNYYGSLHNLAHVFLSRVTDPKGKFGLAPGVMEHFETATRDPAFFRLHKYIDALFKDHKDLLPPYTQDELDFRGVRLDKLSVKANVENAKENTLVTYFDTDMIDLTNAMDSSKAAKDVEIRAQVSRLSHVPFDYEFFVTSNKATTAVARIFLLQKKNWYGEEVSVEEARWGAIELDKFIVKLMPGRNTFKRSSTQSSVSLNERKGYKQLLKEVTDAIEGKQEYYVDKHNRHCGHPHGLLLPKGTPEGMQFRLFVVLTDYEKDIDVESFKKGGEGPHSYCGVLRDNYPDKRPMGFPFDRKITSYETFKTDNMKDVFVTIKHKPLAKVNFSPDEIQAVNSTWSIIYQKPQENGVSLYLNWLTSFPEVQKQFRRFAEVPREQLNENEAFKTQALVTMTRLNDILSSIDKPSEFAAKLRKLAGDHKFRDANVNDFRDFTNIMVEVFAKLSGPAFTPAATSGWRKFFARLLEKIEEETAFTHTKLAKVQLSPEELVAVKNTWKTLSQNIKDNGMDIYLAWFEKYPEMQKRFTQFSDVPRDNLRSDKAFQVQATVTLNRLDSMIHSIDNPSEMAAIMKRLGRVHQDRGTNVYDFRDFTKIFMEQFASKLGSAWTKEAQSGWAKVFAKLVENVGDGLAEIH